MKLNSIKAAIGATTLVALLVSCDRMPDGVIPPDDMAELLADLHKGDALVEIEINKYGTDSLRKQLKQSILLRHGVTQAELDSSMMWYGHNLPKYVEVYENTIKILEDQLDEAREAGFGQMQKAHLSIEGDSVNIWPGLKSARFAGDACGEYITFSLNNDRNWDKGDVYQLHLKQIGASENISYTLVVDYNDGTSEYVTQTPRSDGWQTLKLYLNPDKSASTVYGSIHYTPVSDNDVAYLDSIQLLRTRGLAADSLGRLGQHTFKGIN